MARRRRNIYRRNRRSNTRSVIRGTAAAIITAVVLYFAVAGGLGAWIADKFILPNMGDSTQTPPGQTTPMVASESPAATPQSTPKPQTEEITLAAKPFYGIQLGAFSNQNNAENEAAKTQQRGAAGYIYEDEGRYRVLASAYESLADAEKVREQLLSQQGVESYVLSLYENVGDVTLTVTASSERMQAVKESLQDWEGALEDIIEISRQLDMGEFGSAAARERLTAIAGTVERPLQGNVDVQGETQVLEEIDALMDRLHNSVENIAKTEATAMEISSKIKYTYVESLDRYGRMLSEITLQT